MDKRMNPAAWPLIEYPVVKTFAAAEAPAGESGRITIEPGDSGGSKLIATIASKDPELLMPPVDHGEALEPGPIAPGRINVKELRTKALILLFPEVLLSLSAPRRRQDSFLRACRPGRMRDCSCFPPRGYFRTSKVD